MSAVARGKRPPFVLWWTLWGLGAAVAAISLAIDLFLPRPDHVLGRDFSNLYAAGRLVLGGEAACAFDVECFRSALSSTFGIESVQNYSYPPHALFLAAPFALLPYHAALLAWTVAGAAFFIWAAKPYMAEGFPPVLAVLTPAATLNIWNGHYGFVVGGLWLLAFQWIRERPASSGAAAGLLTIKPHMGLFVAVLMLTKWRAFAAAVLVTLALVALSAIAFGASTWQAFLSSTAGTQLDILGRGEAFYFRMMPSAYVAYRPYGLLPQVAFALAAVALLVRARSLDPFALATATFLVVPYVFNYDMTVACLGFAQALYCRWGALRPAEKAVLMGAFLAPELTYVANWIVPPLLLAALYVQLEPPARESRA